MEEEADEGRLVTYDGVVVPEPAWRCTEKRNPYGSVPGLDDDELADPDELERQVYLAEFGPVLALPVRGRRHGLQPSYDEHGRVDWGAFATVDFERSMPRPDRMRYKLEALREKRHDVLIIFSIIKRHVPGKAKYEVLEYLQQGVIGMEHIQDENMRALAQLWRRKLRLDDEIQRLVKARQARVKRELAAVLA